MKKNNNIVVYTAIANNYDDLIDPKVVSDNIDYYCFTDDMSMESKVWKLLKFPSDDLNSIYKNRFVKILPHKFFSEYEYSIYVDGNIDIIGDLEQLVNKYFVKKKYKLAVPKHPTRNCLYEEAKACIKLKKDDPKIISEQTNKYREKNFPSEIGLTENNIIFRKHNDPEVVNLMKDWWGEFNEFSQRDQLSLLYVVWKNNFDYLPMEINARIENRFFRIRGHKKKGLKRIKQLIKIHRDKNKFTKILYYFINNIKNFIYNQKKN